MAGTPDHAFQSADIVLGKPWQATGLMLSERGEWFSIIRRGKAGLEFWAWGSHPQEVYERAREHVEAVESLLRKCKAA